MPRAQAIAMLLAAAGGVAAAALCARLAPPPLASVAAGTEAAFAVSGLDEREIPPGRAPIRWMGPRSVFVFSDLPAGAATVEVRVRGNAKLVRVSVNDAPVGEIAPDGPRGRFELTAVPATRRLEVALSAEPIVRGERRLGALVGYVRVVPSAQGRLPAALALRLALLAALGAFAAGVAGFGPKGAAVAGVAASAFAALLLAPSGLVHSSNASRLPWLVALAFAVSAVATRALGTGRAGFAALGFAVAVHGILATSPVMVVSDAVFHAHVLQGVAAGDLFPTSVTQHARPFRIPYGAFFYALLVPGLKAGLDPVALVRWGAGLAGCVASVALLGLLRRLGTGRASLGLALFTALPLHFTLYSAGNLSNAFGHWATIGFLAWWAGSTPLGAALGSFLVIAACTSHLSSAIVVTCIAAGLIAARRGVLDRTRVVALGVGFGLSALYYFGYFELITTQLPRLLEGSGGGAAGLSNVGGRLLSAAMGFGLPVLLLSAAGLMDRSDGDGDIGRDLRYAAVGGLLLGLVAAVSPLEVRYLPAVSPALCLLSANGIQWLWKRRYGGWLADLLLTLQAGLFTYALYTALYIAYR
jgi:hypothetical protein